MVDTNDDGIDEVLFNEILAKMCIRDRFILRMLNRTSGSRHKIGDNVFLTVIAYWLGKDRYWLYPVLTGTAYIIESHIRGGYYRSPLAAWQCHQPEGDGTASVY